MTPAEPAAEMFAAAAVARTVAALAVRHFDLAAAVVLHREFSGWRPIVSDGKQADRLLAELDGHTALFDLGESLVVVPDLEDDPRLHDSPDPFLNPTPSTAPCLRFLAASIHGPDAPASAVCLCILDSRPRQLRAEDRKLLVELGEMIAADFWLPTPDATGRTADMIILPRRDHDLSPNAAAFADTTRLEERVLELTRLNASLRAELGTHGEDALEHARFDQLIAESSDCVGLATLDGKIYYLNAAGQSLVGLEGRGSCQAHAHHRLPRARGPLVFSRHGDADAHAHGPLGGGFALSQFQDRRVHRGELDAVSASGPADG